MKLLIRWLLAAAALMLVAYLIPGIVVDRFFPTAFVTALALGLVNAVIRPVVKMLTMPLTCMTLGLFTFVINALMFWLVAIAVDGFEVTGWLAYFAGPIVYSLITAAASQLVK
jgi:putative membrane protein